MLTDHMRGELALLRRAHFAHAIVDHTDETVRLTPAVYIAVAAASP